MIEFCFQSSGMVFTDHNAIILSCLPSEMNLVWRTCSKAEARCDVSLLEDSTLAFTPTVELTELPQYCLQSLRC